MSGAPTQSPQTRWWHTDANSGKVVCTLCPRECHIPSGQRGFCFVRANEGGELVLTTYGRSSGFCIDPVEKKPLNHFLPGTPVLSLGTAGCNLGCKFCQNWDISKSREMDTLAGEATPHAIVEAAKQHGCRSIAFTYNDPTIWAEYAIDIAKIARAENIKTVAVTAGYISPDARREFYQHMDAANVDLKAFTETFYRKLTQTHLEPVLDTLKYLKHETNVWFEITTLVIPGENDSPDELREMSDWVVDHLGDDVPMHFSAFHPDFKMMDKPRTPHEKLIEARQIAIDAGVKYAYVGNVYDLQNESTYCHNCGKCVIERDWYELGTYAMNGNRCAHCDTVIPGVFSDQGSGAPGTWGRKRQPIRIIEPQRSDMSNIEPALGWADRERPKTDFTDDEQAALLAFTRGAVEAAVLEEPNEADLNDDLVDAPAFGVFVTLRRRVGFRACRGRFAGDDRGMRLAELITNAATDAALDDYRFPRIAVGELDRLAIDLSILHSPEVIDARGDAIVNAVTVGKHGLVLNHPRGRGLLLPNVAVEHEWDALTFLQQLARKAQLPPDAWRDDDARIETFQSLLLVQGAPHAELDPASLSTHRMQTLLDILNASMHGQSHDTEDAVLNEQHTEALGIYALTEQGRNGSAVGSGRSLKELADLAGASLRQTPDQPVTRLAVLCQPIRLAAGDYPQRHQTLGGNAVFAQNDDGAWTLAVPSSTKPSDSVAEALRSIRSTPAAWQEAESQGLNFPRVNAFNLIAHRAAEQHTDTRPAARAGQFYPGDADALHRDLDAHFAKAADVERNPVKAVMLPHAGWKFCGDTLAKTIARADVPRNVIILGPNHTGRGAALSVAPHTQWQLPGVNIPIATDIVADLETAGLTRDAAAHEMEHGSEVIAPFLHRMNGDVRIAPIVIGRCTYEQAEALGRAIGDVARKHDALLVISSDMNHFAPEEENRRLDRMALEAMTKGPRDLYDTCTQNQISMCGMLSAVIVMHAIGAHNLEEIDYTTSAAASGDPSSVVGYAGVLLT